MLNGVTIHRLPTITERGLAARHDELFAKAFTGPRPLGLAEQRDWIRATGPNLAGYENWLRRNAGRFDVAVFMTYLYFTTTRGVPAVKGLVPVVLQPTAHDEAPIWLSQFDFIFKLADGFLFFTPEERDFVTRRFRRVAEGAVIGLGFNPPSPEPESLPEMPPTYLVYVGRWDRAKGVERLIRYVRAARESIGIDLHLVVVGEVPVDTAVPAWVRPLGFLSEQAKARAIRGAVALVQPSYFESFSIVLFEAWCQERPVLVQERCSVLKGQVVRSGGGLTFRSEPTFVDGVRQLLAEDNFDGSAGRHGREFVEKNFSWSRILEDLEGELDRVQRGHAKG
jgi:glycosyltransferase involved in cell wall biosynthesis